MLILDEEDEENSPNTKRPRTSINAEQLEGLKNAYNVTRKPSKSMREVLAKKFSLDIKVIQVSLKIWQVCQNINMTSVNIILLTQLNTKVGKYKTCTR